MPGLAALWGKLCDILADPAPLPEHIVNRSVAPMPAAVDVDRSTPHFRFDRTGEDADTVASDVASALEPYLRNRIVRGGDLNCVILEILDTARDGSTFTAAKGWDDDFVTDAVNLVVQREFPRMVANDNDIDYATLVAVALHAAVIAAGLTPDRATFPGMLAGVLKSAQQEVV